MPTQLFPISTTSPWHRGEQATKFDGTTATFDPRVLSTSRGSGLATETTNTVAGATSGVEVGSPPLEWLSGPVDQDVTISGAITGNIWASENNMSANVAINFSVDKIAATDGTITQIVKSARVTEVAVTTRAVNNFTATPGAGVSLAKGDRLRVRIFGDDAGTMASGYTFTIGYNGSSAGADGDTYIQFTENFGFTTAAPSGTKLYLTNTAGPAVGASNEKLMTIAKGAGVVSSDTTAVNGWTAPIQITDTAGGTALEWYSSPLGAFTLSGLALVNLWNQVASGASSSQTYRAEIAVCNSDGSGATVWGSISDADVTASITSTVYVLSDISGDDISVTDGQRLRLRLYLDDRRTAVMGAATVTTRYAGTSDGVDGDTYLQLTQTVTEFAAIPLLVAPRR